MASDGWERIWGLFEGAAALPEDERPAFLDNACGGDADLRRGVEELLVADQRTDVFLDHPVLRRESPVVGSVAAEVDSKPPESDDEGRRIGAYRLLRQVGQGGMSTVYLAVRADDAFQRRVVVKVVRRGMETEDVLRRLRSERQILAGLEHPHIGRLYDGGSTDEGLPYFVLEYVDGLPIDAYCEHRALDLDERLELFSKLCSAVRYAHQNLVVHRDIKPSNILVTADGNPKLLDFGIAKLLNPDLSAAELAATATWHRLLTPSYASPEQVSGKLITTASDVYSLGVLLYQLLTGKLPQDFTNRTMSEIEHLLTESEPVPPSQRLEEGDGKAFGGEALRQLRRRLCGDLDAIVLKALRPRPQDRYSSVEQLTADLDRYREGRPVLARQGNWRYRTGKFLRRNRGMVAAGVALVLFLLGFAAAMAWQARRIAEERDQARLERDKKERVVSLVLELFEGGDTAAGGGAGVTVVQAVAEAVPLLLGRLESQPAQRAEILHAAGRILAQHGVYDRSAQLLQDALTLRRRLYGSSHPDVAATEIALASAFKEKADYPRAEELARGAVATTRELLGATQPLRSAALNELVSVLCYQDQYIAAERFAVEALEVAQQLPEEDSLHLALAADALAVIRNARGEYREAASLFRQSLAAQRSLRGEDHLEQWESLNNLGLALRRLGEPEAARRIFEETLELLRRHLDGRHPRIALVLNNLAGAHFARGDYPGAREAYEQARTILVEAVGTDHWRVFYLGLRLAAVRIHLGEAVSVEGELRDGLEQARGVLGEDHWTVAFGHSVLGEALAAQGRLDEAEPVLKESFLRLVELGAKERHRRDALDRLKVVLESLGREEEARSYEAMMEAG